MSDESEGGVPLQSWIEAVRAELLRCEEAGLTRAMQGNPDALRFEVDRVEIDLEVKTERSVGGNVEGSAGGVVFKVVTGAEGKSSHGNTQRIKLVLKPFGTVVLGDNSPR